jgi:hypothetical protein
MASCFGGESRPLWSASHVKVVIRRRFCFGVKRKLAPVRFCSTRSWRSPMSKFCVRPDPRSRSVAADGLQSRPQRAVGDHKCSMHCSPAEGMRGWRKEPDSRCQRLDPPQHGSAEGYGRVRKNSPRENIMATGRVDLRSKCAAGYHWIAAEKYLNKASFCTSGIPGPSSLIAIMQSPEVACRCAGSPPYRTDASPDLIQ